LKIEHGLEFLGRGGSSTGLEEQHRRLGSTRAQGRRQRGVVLGWETARLVSSFFFWFSPFLLFLFLFLVLFSFFFFSVAELAALAVRGLLWRGASR
jgi:hypothetical protein